MHVLICAQNNQDDPHIHVVADYIKKNKAIPVIFERYRQGDAISFTYDHNRNPGINFKIQTDQFTLNLNEIVSAWWRIKPVLSCEIPGEKSDVHDLFRMYEWRHTLAALEYFLAQVKSINSIEPETRISKKALQLKLAIECGLTLPKTIITNQAQDLFDFFQKEEVVYKTLSSFATQTHGVFTNRIDLNQLKKNPLSISPAPGIFQELIAKDHELRVTIVGDKIFVLKIDSQKKNLTQIDWRRNQSTELFSPGILSEMTKDKILKFHRQAGLIYGAYDFVVDTNGNEVFLECNPSGQWFFHQEIGHEISAAIAKELTETGVKKPGIS